MEIKRFLLFVEFHLYNSLACLFRVLGMQAMRLRTVKLAMRNGISVSGNKGTERGSSLALYMVVLLIVLVVVMLAAGALGAAGLILIAHGI